MFPCDYSQERLRVWSKALDCPVLAVLLSTAPERPYPRPVQEAFYAYAWWGDPDTLYFLSFNNWHISRWLRLVARVDPVSCL